MEPKEQKMTKSDISKGLGYVLLVEKTLGFEYVILAPEQARTFVKKRMFLEILSSTMGVVAVACKETEVSRQTYYRWMKEDKVFAHNVMTVNSERNDEIEDRLFQKIREGSGADIRYYLDRKHPLYRPRMIQEVIAGDRTLEDLIDEDEQKLNGEETTNKSVVDRKLDVDQEQEGQESQV